MQTPSPDLSRQDVPEGHASISLLQCGACGELTYPASAYGCNMCGAPRDAGRVLAVDARGTLRNYITVYGDFVPGLKTPYVVGEVELARNVIEQVLIAVSDESVLRIGQTLVGKHPQPGDDGGNERLRNTLRFVPEQGGPQ